MKTIFIAINFIALTTSLLAQIQKGQDINGETAYDWSGYTVSMPDASTVAIGAYQNDGGGNSSGHVRIYKWNGSSWSQKGADINGEVAGDNSGCSVSMPDANTVAIGAYKNAGNGNQAGHVRIFAWSGSSWLQKGVDIDGETAWDWSGMSVSMPNENTVAIGAPTNSGNGTLSGQVRIYAWNGSAWMQKGVDIDGETAYDNFGCSVSMPNENTVAIGASYNSNENGSESGHVRIYSWIASTWVQKGTDIDGEADDDNSGCSVSMPDSNTVAIGAMANYGSENDGGYVRIFTWNGSAWVQKGSDIDGETAGDASGCSVSMPNSDIVAIGASYNNGNGSGSGHVRIFSWNGSSWVQNGIDIVGEAIGDHSGCSVSMPDANTVAIGAYMNDGNGIDSGHVRAFSVCTNTYVSDVITACDSYTWIDGITYSASNSTATHTLANAAGCDSIVTLNLTITTIDNTVSLNGSSLTASITDAIYQWIDCSNGSDIVGANSQSFTPEVNGDYAVEITLGNCNATSVCTHVIVDAIGIQHLSPAKLYPNPNQGIFTIENAKSSEYTIFDATGRVVTRGIVESDQFSIESGIGEPGVYMLRLQNLESTQSIPFIIE